MIRLFKNHYSRLSLIILFSISVSITKAQTWSPVGNGMVGGYVYSLCAYDSVLYAGGTFIDPDKHLAQWDGYNWWPVGGGINGYVYCLTTYKSCLYAGGWFNKAGGNAITDTARNLAGWNGSDWFKLEDGARGIVYAMDTLNKQLLIPNDYYPGLGEWNGKLWNSTPPGFIGYGYPNLYTYAINAMASYNGHLYVAIYGPSNGITHNTYTVVGYVYKLNAVTKAWTLIVSLPYDANYGDANCLAVYNNKLYIGGVFDSANGQPANNIAIWNDTVLTVPSPGINGTVSAFTVYNNALYVGGLFDSAGGMPAHNIACWNDTNWTTLGNGVNNQVFAMTSYNGELYVGGGFTSPYNYIAKYDPPTETAVKTSSQILFPNPNYGTFTLSSKAITSGSQLEVFNFIGQKICTLQLNSATTTISLLGCSGGIYFYRITGSGNNKIATGKFIVL
jgi:hypothetical protein